MAHSNTLGRYARCLREPMSITTPVEVARYLSDQVFSPFAEILQEEVWVLTLNARRRVTHEYMASRGTADASIATPSIVFREAIKLNASSIIVAHNHPSGDPEPSEADLTLTTRLTRSGKILGITLVDHIVIGQRDYYSIISDKGDTLAPSI